MNLIRDYCYHNELLLNLKKGKTEVMLFGTSQRLRKSGKNLNITYNNTVINFVTEYVYLGNVIDNHMSLNENFHRSYKRASGRLRLLQSVRRNLTVASAIDIYNMILPILTYSSTIKTIFTDSQLAKYTSFERRACKVIGTKSIPNTKELMQSQICSMVENFLAIYSLTF